MAPVCLLIVWLSFSSIMCMTIPDDIEILEGYNFDVPSELYTDDGPSQEHLLTRFHPIRDKRSYQVVESPGLVSHFRENHVSPFKRIIARNAAMLTSSTDDVGINENNYMQNIAYNKLRPPLLNIQNTGAYDESWSNLQNLEGHATRRARNAEATPDSASTDYEEKSEKLPSAEKQVMENNYYAEAASNQNPVQDKWGAPIVRQQEYSTIRQAHEDDDTMAEATIKDAFKSRTPRVNFVTQQKKAAAISEAPEPRDRDQNLSAAKPEYYKKPYERYQAYSPRLYDDYPAINYDPYNRRYERYDHSIFTPPPPPPVDGYYYNNRRYDTYDPYMPRQPMYRDPYYYYQDRGYDVSAEPRDYRPIHTNDLDDRYRTIPNRNTRIIYYATLPEVVRTPPGMAPPLSPMPDVKYSAYERYGPQMKTNAMSGAYRNSRLPRDYDQQQKDAQNTRDPKTSKSFNTDSVRLTSGIHIKDQRN